MARIQNNTSKNTATHGSIFEVLEGRTMYSASPSVVGYLPDYEAGSAMMATLQNAKFEGVTQLNYFSVIPTATGVLPGTRVGAETNPSTKSSSDCELSQLDTVVSDAHAAGVKVDIVVGGAQHMSDNLGKVVDGGTATWNALASSIQQFATTHNVDGVDLDWEPASLSADETENYGDLIATIHQANPSLCLSAAVNPEHLDVAGADPAYVLDAKAVQNLTSINVMAYDLEIGNVSPIGHAETDMNNWNTYVQANGGSTGQLIFAVPFYGTSGTTWGNTTPEGYARLINDNGQIPAASADQVTIGGTQWNYNGPATIFNKTTYALSNHFGGVAAWEIGQDYLSNGSYDSTYSLLPQIQNAINSYNDSTGAAPVDGPAAPVTTTPVKLSGTVIGTAGSYRNNGNTAAKVFDDKLNTYFDAPSAGTASNPDWVGLDLGSAQSLTQIKFAARAGYESRMEGGLFQGANTANFSDGVNLYTVDNTSAPSSSSLTSVTATGTFRYVRFLAPAGAFGNIAEMQVFGAAPVSTGNNIMTVANNTISASTSPFATGNKLISEIAGLE